MSFNLSGLSVYTNELSTELVTRALLEAQSVNYLTVKANLTAGTTSVNILGGTADLIDATCGFDAADVGSNSTAFTQVQLCTVNKQLKEKLCPETLREYWLSSQMSPSAYQESVPFEAQISNYKIEQINAYVENAIWNGDGVSGSCLVGLLDQISIANGAEDGSAFAGSWAVASAVANAWGMIDLLPTAVKQMNDVKMYMSYDQYSRLVQGLLDAGNSILTQYDNISNAAGKSGGNSFIFPGTSVEVVATGGITSTQVIVGSKSYAFFGCGLMDDSEKLRMYYNEADDVVNVLGKMRFGTAALADQFVSNV